MNSRMESNDWLLLSAYVDGQLSPGERIKLENQLNERPELEEELRSLKLTRALLRRHPTKPVPHNFTLTTLMARQAQRRTFWLPALSFSSLIAAFLLIVSFAIRMPQVPSPAMAPLPMAAAEPERAIGFAAEEKQPPMIIVWGGPALLKVGAGKGGGEALPSGDAAYSVMEPAIEAAPMHPGNEALEPPEVMEALPPVEAAELFAEAAPPEKTAVIEATATPVPPEEPLSGSEPILGVRPAAESGEMTFQQPHRIVKVDSEELMGSRIPFLRIGLTAFFLLTGVTAFMLWKRSRL